MEIKSDAIRYRIKDGEINFINNVKIDDKKNDLIILSQKISYDLSDQKIFGKGNNKIIDELQNTYILNEFEYSIKEKIIKLYEERKYSKLIRLIMDLADDVNKYINEQTPWKKDINEAVSICSTSLNAFKIITIYLSPIIPNITKNAYKFLNLENCSFDDVDIKLSGKINTYKSLLNRLEPLIIPEEDNMENENIIDIKQFSNVDLRVAKILKAEDVKDADKLIQLTLDVGELGTRNVFAGIKDPFKLVNPLSSR